MGLTVSTPYKSGTVSSVSGTGFIDSGAPFVAGDVGRAIRPNTGNASGQTRKIVAYVSATEVTVDHAWDTSPIPGITEHLPTAGDTYWVSYSLDDLDDGTNLIKDISQSYRFVGTGHSLSNCFIYDVSKTVYMNSDNVRINTTAHIRFGDRSPDGYSENGCVIIDDATNAAGQGYGGGTGNTGDFVLNGCYAFGTTDVIFWRFYRATNHITRLVDCVLQRITGRFQGAKSALYNTVVRKHGNTGGGVTTKSPFGVVEGLSATHTLNSFYWNPSISGDTTISNLQFSSLITSVININGGADATLTITGVDLDLAAQQPAFTQQVNYSSGTPVVLVNNTISARYAEIDGTAVSGWRMWVHDASTTVVADAEQASAQGATYTALAHRFTTTSNGTQTLAANGVSYRPFTVRIRHFLYAFVEVAWDGKRNVSLDIPASQDTRVTAASKTAAQAVGGIGWNTGVLEITADVTTAEMWDWVKAWLCDNPAEDDADYIDGALSFAGLDITLAAGVTVTGSLTTSGTVTLGSGASIAGVYTDSTGTSATLTLAGLQDASVLLVDGSGTTVEFQAAQSGEFDYVRNFAPGATGTWRWVAKAPGREHATGTFTPGAGGAFSYTPVLTQKLTPSGDPMYTGTTSALVSVSIPGTTTAYIDIGDGTAPLQESFNETELALVTQAGLEWIAAGKDDVSVFDSGSGDYLFLTAGWRVRRASAGDANAAIEAYVTSADGAIVDDTNGPVLYLTSNTPAAIAAAVWAYIDRELTQAIPTAAQIADTMLGRNLAGGSDGGRTVRDALRASRNKSAISGSTLTVYQEDDATPAWTAAVSTAERDALQSIDPA